MSEGANSENSFQNPEATRFSRRTFIRKAGESALGAAAFLYSRDSTLANGQTQEATQPVETEIASIEHAGWNFIVNLDELQSYTAQRGSTVQIDVIGGYGSKQPHIEYRQGKPDISNQCIRLNLDGKSTGVLEVLPNPHQEDILLSIKEIEGDTLINENPLTVPLETHTYRPEDEDDRKRIFSEVLLDSDTLRELHEQAKYRYLNERDGPVFKIQNDPRFIPIGKVLSRTGLDEIPQLWNIVKGEMAFVGPRPLPMYETKKIEGIYSKRFSVLPGLTSLWVVRGAHQLNFREWMELDIWYVDHRSIQMDLKILLLTVLVLSQFILKQISMIIFDNK